MGDPAKEPIDLRELHEIMENDLELVRECFEDFIKISSKMLIKIKDSIDMEDAHGLNRTAHTFKGTLKYLAALSAADMAYELEVMGEQGDFEKAGEIYHTLVEECERLKEFMIKY